MTKSHPYLTGQVIKATVTLDSLYMVGHIQLSLMLSGLTPSESPLCVSAVKLHYT